MVRAFQLSQYVQGELRDTSQILEERFHVGSLCEWCCRQLDESSPTIQYYSEVAVVFKTCRKIEIDEGLMNMCIACVSSDCRMRHVLRQVTWKSDLEGE